jgi:hypothetical protein
MTITPEQIIVLSVYFVAVYLYKYLVAKDSYPVLRALIPAFNLIVGLILGAFGVADFAIHEAVIGTFALGGLADLAKTPKKVLVAAGVVANSN